MAIFNDSKVKSKSWMISVSTQVTNIKEGFPFPAIPVKGDLIVWAKGEHDNQYGVEIADWEFALEGRDHQRIMEALTLFITAEEYVELTKAIEAELGRIAMDAAEEAPKQSVPSNKAVLVEDIMNLFDIKGVITDAVNDARIEESVDLEVSMSYGRDFTIEVEYDPTELIRDIANAVEDAILNGTTE